MSKIIKKIGDGILAADKSRRSVGPKPAEPLCQRELASMEKSLESVDGFLTLQGKDQLSPALQQCFVTWSQLLPLQAENDRAEIALSAFYRKGKIGDYLKGLRDFVERMDTVDSDETARKMGFYNYIFFLKQYMDAMKKQYGEAVPCLERPACTPDNVAWFIGAECGQIAPIRDLPKARAAARQMLEQAEAGKRPPKKFEYTIGELSTALEELKNGTKKPKEHVERLGQLNGILNARAEALRENIKKGTELYNALIDGMTEEWFQQFEPEADPVREMTRTELKAFYQKRLDTLALPEKE